MRAFAKEDVEPAKGSARLRRGGAQRGQIALIEMRFTPACSSGFDEPSSLGEFVACRRHDLKCRTDRSGNVDAHHVGALARRSNRRCSSDARAAPVTMAALPCNLPEPVF